MKNLINLCVLGFILVIGTKSFAQTFGVRAGMNLSNILMEYDGESNDDLKMNPGFHIGPTLEVPLNEIFSFESGLIFSTKGFKTSEKETYNGHTFESKQKANLFYLDIPLTAKVTYDVGSAKIFGTFGPYVGMGLTGKVKYKYTEDGETETDKEDINFGSDEDEDDLRRLDYGLAVGAGIEIKAFQVGVNYSLGLANLSIYEEDELKIKNRVLGISVGYKFGKN